MKEGRRILGAALLLLFAAGELDANQLKDRWRKRKEKKQDVRAEKILQENYQPGKAWEAYFRDEEGRTRAIRLPVEQNDDRWWMGLTFTDYSGPRLRLGVMKIRNNSPIREATGELYGHLEVSLSGIEELLSTALFRTHRFDLVERKRLEAVFGEQDLGASGRINPHTAARIGKVEGVDYLIYGVVNEWAPSKKADRVGLRMGLGVGKKQAEVAMSFTVADADTGEVLHQLTRRATAQDWSLQTGLGRWARRATASTTKTSPVSYAVQACINKAAYAIAMALKERPWRGSVSRISESSVWINAGSDRGMRPGLTLTALAKGPAILDHETKAVLGEATEAIGTLVITSVEEKYSVANIVEGCDGLKAGDRVELSEEAPAMDSVKIPSSGS